MFSEEAFLALEPLPVGERARLELTVMADSARNNVSKIGKRLGRRFKTELDDRDAPRAIVVERVG